MQTCATNPSPAAFYLRCLTEVWPTSALIHIKAFQQIQCNRQYLYRPDKSYPTLLPQNSSVWLCWLIMLYWISLCLGARIIPDMSEILCHLHVPTRLYIEYWTGVLLPKRPFRHFTCSRIVIPGKGHKRKFWNHYFGINASITHHTLVWSGLTQISIHQPFCNWEIFISQHFSWVLKRWSILLLFFSVIHKNPYRKS